MQELLHYLHDTPGYTEIRAIKDGDVQQSFFHSTGEALELAKYLSEGEWDVYYGVLRRLTPRGTSLDVAQDSDVLWADLDSKTESKQATLTRLVGYDIPPAVIVDSGHGYHAYWKLSAYIPTPRACVIMRGLAKQLHGDHVYDPPRILRVPGTTNWKDPSLPLPVRVLRFDTTRDMRPGDFEVPERLGWRELEPRPPVVTEYVPQSDREELPDWLTQLIQEGVPQGQRSEAAFKVMVHLAKRGWSDAEIQSLFETQAIGEKYREMRSGGQRWLDRSLSKARTSR